MGSFCRSRWSASRIVGLAIALLHLSFVGSGCSQSTVIRTSPADARVYIDGEELHSNSFQYGRWIGNEYRMRVEAPGYKTEERILDVHVASWAAIAMGPLWWPWMGELPTQIYVELEEVSPRKGKR